MKWFAFFASVCLLATVSFGSSFEVGANVSNAYTFRGLPQLTDEFVVNPYVGLDVTLLDVEGGLVSGLDLFGNVNAVVSTDGDFDYSSTSWLYEASYTGGAKTSLLNNWVSLSVGYTFYNSPSNAFDSVQEVFGVVELNDYKLWNGSKVNSLLPTFTGLRPYVLYAYELENTRGLGDDSASYLEVGVRPGVTVYNNVSLTVPVRATFGLDGYYDGEGSQFGFVGVGPQVVVPFSENWYFNGGVEFQFYGSELQDSTDQSDLETVAYIGVSYKR